MQLPKCYIIRSYAKNVFGGKITLNGPDKDQRNIIAEFKKNTKPNYLQKEIEKGLLLEKYMPLMKVEKWYLVLLKVEYFH